jgi:uroporphyrinogen-III synthase
MTSTTADSIPTPRPEPGPATGASGLSTAAPARSDVLAGFTVAVTSDRRRDELALRLEEHGARVVLAPALRVVPVTDESALRATTHHLLEAPPDAVVATTVFGLFGWLDAADGWGLGEPLRAMLAAASVVARWPRPGDELRAAGLDHAWSPPTESVTEVVDHLMAHFAGGRRPRSRRSTAVNGRTPVGSRARPATTRSRRPGRGPLSGRRVAVQLHGVPEDELCSALAAAGAEVIEVPLYRWAPPVDPTPLQRLIDLITSRLVDAVTFTSAVAVGSVLRAAGPDAEAVLTALRGPVLVGCVGPQAADPLRRVGVPALAPARARMSALVATLVDELPRRTHTLQVAGCELVLRGHAAVVDGVLKPLPPAQMAILRSLAAAPGRVLPRSELLEALPRGADEHAVEMAVARLRAALGRPSFIQTVVKRGYRLRTD